jgi:hypothetical protein
MVAAMRRDIGQGDVPDITISPKAKAIVDYLDLTWLKGEKDQEAVMVELSLQRYTAFRRFLRRVSLTPKEQRAKVQTGEARKLSDLTHTELARLLREHLPGADSFVRAWTTDVHNMATNWSKWTGRLVGQAWRPDHKRFRKHIKEFTQGWEKYWIRLLELWRENEEA